MGVVQRARTVRATRTAHEKTEGVRYRFGDTQHPPHRGQCVSESALWLLLHVEPALLRYVRLLDVEAARQAVLHLDGVDDAVSEAVELVKQLHQLAFQDEIAALRIGSGSPCTREALVAEHFRWRVHDGLTPGNDEAFDAAVT